VACKLAELTKAGFERKQGGAKAGHAPFSLYPPFQCQLSKVSGPHDFVAVRYLGRGKHVIVASTWTQVSGCITGVHGSEGSCGGGGRVYVREGSHQGVDGRVLHRCVNQTSNGECVTPADGFVQMACMHC
jgi:hypothetical protein